MVLYRYIGQDVTNANGVASINYTGVGKGKMEIVASTDDQSHISEGSLQSKTYAIIDATFKDDAIDGAKNYKWVNQKVGNAPVYNIQVETDGTHIQKTNNGNLAPSNVENSFTWTDRIIMNQPFAVEFDLVEVNVAGGAFRLYYNNNKTQQLDVTNTGTGHYKFMIDSNSVKYIKDNGNPVTIASGLTITTWETPSFVNCGDIKFANFIMYPI